MSAPYTLHLGDCLEVLKSIPDNSIDSVVTDPPYGLTSARPGGRSNATRGAVMGGFMGLEWDSDIPSVEIWMECLRVLKPGGHLLAFAGTRTQHRMAVRIEDAGFEIRDMIAWVYGSGFPKSKNLDGDWQGWGTALKPALEPITVARKPLSGTVAANALEHGTGAIHIDACRIPAEPMPANTGSGGMPRRREDEQRGPGQVAQPHAEGRWPANLIHDGSDEVLAAFPDAPGQLADASLNSEQRKTQNVYGAMRRGREGEASANSANGGIVGFSMRPGARRLDVGSAARFFYCAKTSRRERATPGRNFDRLPSAGGGLKYTCTGDDDSLVLRVDHKNGEFGFIGPKGEEDEAFFLACTPKAVLELIAEVERLRNRLEIDERTPYDGIACRDETIKGLDEKCDRLKAENEALRQFAAEAYQVLGALDAPENVLDNASDAASGVPPRHETLLPFFAEGYEALRKDAERWRYARTILPYEVIQDSQKDFESWGADASEAENKRCDDAIDAALEGGGK